MSVYGEHLFGRVHSTPGLFYVATMFWHINFVPLIPLRTFVVLEGTEKDEGFHGKRIRMSFRSVLAGYLRGWLAAAAILSAGAGALAAGSFYFGAQGANFLIVLALSALVVGLFWFIFATRTWWFLPVQATLLLGSIGVYHDIRTRVPNAARVANPPLAGALRQRHDTSYIGALLLANAVGVLYSLTRLLTPASYRQAVVLGQELGLAPEQVTDYFIRRHDGVFVPPDETG